MNKIDLAARRRLHRWKGLYIVLFPLRRRNWNFRYYLSGISLAILATRCRWWHCPGHCDHPRAPPWPRAHAPADKPTLAPTPTPVPTLAPTPAAAVYTWPVKGAVILQLQPEVLACDLFMGTGGTTSMDIAAEQGAPRCSITNGTVESIEHDST